MLKSICSGKPTAVVKIPHFMCNDKLGEDLKRKARPRLKCKIRMKMLARGYAQKINNPLQFPPTVQALSLIAHR